MLMRSRYLPGVCVLCTELFGDLLKVRLHLLLSMLHASHDEDEVFVSHIYGGMRSSLYDTLIKPGVVCCGM